MVTGSVAFYKRPEPLAADKHGKLGVSRQAKAFVFAKQTHVVPLTLGEFAAAGLDFPIIFAGADRVPLAVMGMREGANLFISEDGAFETHRYIPAFIRRYPFVFAEDRANKRFIACIDVEAPMVGENAEIALFNGAEPSPYTKDAVNFLTGFEQQRRETEEFVKHLTELDLFHSTKLTLAQTRADGTQADPVDLADYIAVSLEKLKGLPHAKLAELLNKGYLAAIHVHLHSLRAWQWLIQRASERQAATPSTVN